MKVPSDANIRKQCAVESPTNMGFIEQLLAIAKNTFFECVRQPISLVILIASTLLVLMSNPLSAFTMMDDQRMYVDIGLSTVFMCGALLAA
ncbi:MAG: hypothetical protein RL692_509, partial [Planctomycetota bacterium]